MARLFSTIAAIVVVTAALSAQVNVAGSWDLSINGPEGVITATAALKQDGEALYKLAWSYYKRDYLKESIDKFDESVKLYDQIVANGALDPSRASARCRLEIS